MRNSAGRREPLWSNQRRRTPSKPRVTCDDGGVVFSAGHMTDAPLLEVADGPRHSSLEVERPVTELSELTQTEGEDGVL